MTTCRATWVAQRASGKRAGSARGSASDVVVLVRQQLQPVCDQRAPQLLRAARLEEKVDPARFLPPLSFCSASARLLLGFCSAQRLVDGVGRHVGGLRTLLQRRQGQCLQLVPKWRLL